jgi:hypothetical protein
MTTNPRDVIAAMRPDERAALEAGFRMSDAPSLEDFLSEQVTLYRSAPEDDPRLKTWFYGPTLERLSGTDTETDPMATEPTTGATKILSAKLGKPTISKPSRSIPLRKAAPLPMPGSHAALRRRLFGGK